MAAAPQARDPLAALRACEDDGLSRGSVLVLAATHGNERNGAWLLACAEDPGAPLRQGLPVGRGLDAAGLAVRCGSGNPAALAANRRYLERDLNRSFSRVLLQDPSCREQEVGRARQLLEQHGPSGSSPCLVAVDLHSTTACMGSCLVIYSRRPTDLALAAGLQGRLGLPVYLHEGDPAQTGYLVERWPAGVVIEVGPVPQGVVQASIVSATRLALQATLELLAQARHGALALPRQLVLHRHLGSLDLPRDAAGRPLAMVHPRLQGRDWQPLQPGAPLFLDGEGGTIAYDPARLEDLPQPPPLDAPVWPVFINEAAYGEKGIALSLTLREVWQREPTWGPALQTLARRLEVEGG
ncbi:MAG: aspartoacylase [Synechococcaceae cyanobacterium]|nr:aspartoacylase [Synechococcaceae cyanobacterium]